MLSTRDHDVIRQWADLHDAVPAEIFPRKFDGEPAVLYFLFGKARTGTPELHPIAWDTFFVLFDLLNLSIAFDADSTQFQITPMKKFTQVAPANAVN